jgi:hypothetical protein
MYEGSRRLHPFARTGPLKKSYWYLCGREKRFLLFLENRLVYSLVHLPVVPPLQGVWCVGV